MYSGGKTSRLKVDILGMAESWTNSGKCVRDDHVLIYIGHKAEHKHGVCILLTKKMAKSLMGFHAVSDKTNLITNH